MYVLRGISPRTLSILCNIDLGRVIPTFSVLSTAIVPFIPVFYIALPSIKDIDDYFVQSFIRSFAITISFCSSSQWAGNIVAIDAYRFLLCYRLISSSVARRPLPNSIGMYCLSCEEDKKVRYMMIRVLVAALSVTTLKMAAIISALPRYLMCRSVLLSWLFTLTFANILSLKTFNCIKLDNKKR
jgi:hypothetical protein